ncbi:Lrp/AsnC family transcriptional regulator, partial [Salmonella enterica subsp. enterica serovar Istanbul]|nr:Lrp/AsnC family transcriptional regulator [Salmonella enterica subsp. enterica serovar Istanbul]
QEVQQAVRRMEEQKIICGYHTVINYNKVLRDERIMAFIEVEVSPMKGKGYDHTAALLAKYPEIDSLYLITGDNDFICLVQG